MTQDINEDAEFSSLFSTTQDDNAKKLNNLIARAMRLLGQRDHGEAELRRKLLTPPQPFTRPSSYKNRKNQQSSSPTVATAAKEKEVEEICPEQVEQVIAYCYEHGWLDDARFADRYIAGRSRRGLGAQRIRSELMQKGVDKEVINLALENCEVDWCTQAYELATRKFGQPLPVDWKEKSKVLRYLLYRGFFQEEIQSIYRDFED
ncbi:MAG: recombination regulator RecX [Rouxiella badensis]|nr:recombination regulator RecX [Rouxiella badensis]QOI53672.1 recombination regulator RecX [Rouxiella badensis subsp. acadiensis]